MKAKHSEVHANMGQAWRKRRGAGKTGIKVGPGKKT